MTQLDLLEYGARQRDAGMQRASAAQESKHPGWADQAYAALLRLAREQPEVHANDMAAVFHEQPAHANAWGSVWQRAIREGIIRHSGRVRRCADPKKHAHLSPEYTSLIYREH